MRLNLQMKLVTVTRNFAKCLIAAVLAVACTVKETVETQAPKPSEPAVSSPFIPGEISVEFNDEMVALIEAELAGQTKAPSFTSSLESYGIESMERVFPHAGPFEERTRREGLHRFYNVTFKADIPVTKAGEAIAELPGVVSVTPHRKIAKRGFNDPKFSNQWHYVNKTTSGADINVQGVWDNYTVGSNSVVVCVVDEPVDPTHPDLLANLWHDGEGHTGYNFVRNNYNLSIRPEGGNGDFGHGTHVAGTISAVNNNGTGVVGIAGGDAEAGIGGVLLQSCAIFSGTADGHDDDAVRAIKWGADHGAVISQNSWGLYADMNNDGTVSSKELSSYKSLTIDDDPELKAAIDYFIKYAGCDNQGNQLPDSPMKGGLVVFAAGNENIDWDPYCAYEPVIAVGAFNQVGNKASYSNWGTWVNVAAPGGEGTTSANSIWSTLPTNITTSGYGGVDWAGTSMACPHVSGVLALIISYYGGPGFTNDRAKEILYAGLGNTIGSSKPVGKKLDALKSFEYGGTSVSDPLSLGVKSVTMHAHETRVLQLTVKAGSSATVECITGSPALYYDNASKTVTITGKNAAAGTYEATFTLKQSGQEDFSITLTYTILPNHAPKVSLGSYKFENLCINATGVSFYKTKPADLGVLFADEDGETVTVTVENSNPEVVGVTDSGNKFTIDARQFGISTITVKGTDALGESASFSFMVAVKDSSKGAGVEAFPEVVCDKVSFWPSTEQVKKYDIVIYSGSGAKVLTLSEEGGLYSPIEVDITGLAPGVYTAYVTPQGGSSQKVKFLKY